MESGVDTLEEVKNYYGKVLSTNKDLQSNACCIGEAVPDRIKEILPLIHDEVHEKFYGCGSPIPEALDGCTVLDLGCGSGRDCYLLSKLVGPKGKVIGVDMTDEQLEVARTHIDYQAEKFGYSKSNVEFRQGYIEDLAAIDIADNSIDIVVSNCVINLSPNKPKVFSEIFRVLKPGGELYFSDVFTGRRIPEQLRKDPTLHGECLSGALYNEDFRRMLDDIGCPDSRTVSSSVLELNNADIKQRIGMVEFFSKTVRAFKVNGLEDRCEDYGQVAYYQGTIEDHPHGLWLDDHHYFETNKPLPVCGNTAAMISDSRFGKHFRLEGDRSTHFGLFDCEPSSDNSAVATQNGACC